MRRRGARALAQAWLRHLVERWIRKLSFVYGVEAVPVSF
jgi:hypothetical protein